MKILYVITCGDRGGSQVTLLDLVRNLPAGFEAVVASGQDGYLERGCKKTGIPFRRVTCLVREIHPLRDLVALFQLILLIGRERPDVVHAHTSKAGILARLAARIMRTPSVFTAHTWSFDADLPRLIRWLAVPLERFAAWVSGTIITVSDANTRKALRRAIAPRRQLVRIWVGIPDTNLFAQPGAHDPVTLVMVARFTEQKDHKLLLRALEKVDGNWILQLVGDGPLLKQVQTLTCEMKLEGKVQFLGERADVVDSLARADIFILASRWEGLPRVILEAMRAGLPVVATNVGGVGEMVDDGVTGFLTPPGDFVRLRDRIQTLIDSAPLRAALGASARRRFERDFRIETCVRKIVSVYRAAVADPKNDNALAGEEYAG